MATKLCDTCSAIFKENSLLQEVRPHHLSAAAVHAASEQGCYIGSDISRELQADLEHDNDNSFVLYLGPIKGLPEGWLKLSITTCVPDPTSDEYDPHQDSDADNEVHGDVESVDGAMHDLGCWGWSLQREQGTLYIV